MKQFYYWPFAEKLHLQQDKFNINFASLFLKKDIEIKNVKSLFNISYSTESLQTFDIHTPVNYPAPLPCVFYFHGGAWYSADKNIYTPFCKKLASLGFVVCNINYRLMPEVEIEDCISDCICAVKYILSFHSEYNINPLKLFTAGDSAGAHLASFVITQLQKEKDNFKFIGCGLFYGVFDLTLLKFTKFPVLKSLHNRYVKLFEKNKLSTKPFKTSELFNYYKKLSTTTYLTNSFPPTFIASGKIDKLHNQTVRFISLLKQKKIPYLALIFPKHRKDGIHAFLNLPFLNSAKTTFEKLSQFFLLLANKQ